MGLDKELALALDFKNAPKELQDAATAHYANTKALNKAKQKVAEDQILANSAQNAYDASAAKVRELMKKWEPGV